MHEGRVLFHLTNAAHDYFGCPYMPLSSRNPSNNQHGSFGQGMDKLSQCQVPQSGKACLNQQDEKAMDGS